MLPEVYHFRFTAVPPGINIPDFHLKIRIFFQLAIGFHVKVAHPAGDVHFWFFPGMVIHVIPQPFDYVQTAIARIIRPHHIVPSKFYDSAEGISQNG